MEIIQEIKNRMSIADLLNQLKLDVNASGFVHSIYKQDRTPSMKIYFDENRYWCFASHNGGDVVNFYQDYYNLDISTAIKELASLCGIEQSETTNVKRETNSKEKSFAEQIGELNRIQENLFNCLSGYEKSIYEENYYKKDYADNFEAHISALRAVQQERLITNRQIFNEFYQYCVTYYNLDALKYINQKRNLPAEIITRFKLCTINNYFQLNKHMLKHFEIEKLQRSGLYNEKGNLIFASHLIVIPYLHKNSIVYLRGRYFDSKGNTDPKDGDYHIALGKYIGLKNDAVDLNKTKRFYNSDVIRTMLKGERLYIVEGEFDAMALTSIGRNAIAVPGASNIPEDKYFIPLLEFDIYLCMDDDDAGTGLKNRLIDIFKNYNKNISIVKLPTKDINDFIKEDKVNND